MGSGLESVLESRTRSVGIETGTDGDPDSDPDDNNPQQWHHASDLPRTSGLGTTALQGVAGFAAAWRATSARTGNDDAGLEKGPFVV